MKNQPPLLLGCIADDFTGASDAASFLVNGGVSTILCNGIPKDLAVLQGCGAAVIALKTRSAPAQEAVRDTLAAAMFLKACGARQLYLKYCSTFDSTPAGNIGPAVDALLEEYKLPYTLLCPSLPVNGRQVRNGRLYVNGVPLHESHMKNHPLNPMWSSDIPTLMREQGKYPALVLDAAALQLQDADVHSRVDALLAGHPHGYIIPEYETDAQGARIAQLFGGLPLLTGGSGLLAHLASGLRGGADAAHSPEGGVAGRALLLSGSCSAATREQVRCYRQQGGAALSVDPVRLLDGSLCPEALWEFAAAHANPLFYSAESGPEGCVCAGVNPQQAAHVLEQALAALGHRALGAGYTRVIVAGGETSGAVTQALGFQSFLVGKSIAPGVPVLAPLERRDMRLVLKSGNFGQRDFFRQALAATGQGAD